MIDLLAKKFFDWFRQSKRWTRGDLKLSTFKALVRLDLHGALSCLNLFKNKGNFVVDDQAQVFLETLYDSNKRPQPSCPDEVQYAESEEFRNYLAL